MLLPPGKGASEVTPFLRSSCLIVLANRTMQKKITQLLHSLIPLPAGEIASTQTGCDIKFLGRIGKKIDLGVGSLVEPKPKIVERRKKKKMGKKLKTIKWPNWTV